MLATAHAASTAVTPRCPRCGLPVRCSVQLRADEIDLRARVLAARTAARDEGTEEAVRRFRAVLAQAEGQFDILVSELAGSHFTCPVYSDAIGGMLDRPPQPAPQGEAGARRRRWRAARDLWVGAR